MLGIHTIPILIQYGKNPQNMKLHCQMQFETSLDLTFTCVQGKIHYKLISVSIENHKTKRCSVFKGYKSDKLLCLYIQFDLWQMRQSFLAYIANIVYMMS